MPTLEDTIDFPVTTLSDLLEADAKAGVAAAPDEEKYRRWAFLSSGAAGILALILVVVLITGTGGGGGGDGGSSSGKTLEAPAGTVPTAVTVSKNGLTSGVLKQKAIVSVIRTTDQAVLASGATVLGFEDVKGTLKGFDKVKFELAVQPDEQAPVETADANELKVVSGKLPKTPAQPAPVEQAPAAPAPTEQTPPASG